LGTIYEVSDKEDLRRKENTKTRGRETLTDKRGASSTGRVLRGGKFKREEGRGEKSGKRKRRSSRNEEKMP